VLTVLSKTTLLIVGLLIFGIAYTAFTNSESPGTVTTPVPSGFTIGGNSFTFNYTAISNAQREAGLMGKRVTINTTMLFAFPSKSDWTFWMYGTNSSLDIIWVNATDGSGEVVYLVANVPPCLNLLLCPRYSPTSPANYVIEAGSGFASAHGVKPGTKIAFIMK